MCKCAETIQDGAKFLEYAQEIVQTTTTIRKILIVGYGNIEQ